MLSGVNELCMRCTEECKQWLEVKVIKCPFYKFKKGSDEEI